MAILVFSHSIALGVVVLFETDAPACRVCNSDDTQSVFLFTVPLMERTANAGVAFSGLAACLSLISIHADLVKRKHKPM